MSFTDIHSHILPGYDDGAFDAAEFLEMARVAVRGGTARMAATPHYDLDLPNLEPAGIRAAVQEHLGLLRSQGISLALVPGVEVRVSTGLYNLARRDGALDGLSLGGGGNYILVDLPLVDLPVATADILFLIQLRGFTPILAHPERNRHLASHPQLVRELAERGIEMQVNSGSLEGLYGRTAHRAALALLGEGTARLVASDAHAPNGRSPDLSGADRLIRSRFGDTAARVLLEVNPELVLAGQDLEDTRVDPTRRARGARWQAGRKRS